MGGPLVRYRRHMAHPDWIGRPLVRLNFDKQRCEADFRFGLVRFRENTEGVALYRGEADSSVVSANDSRRWLRTVERRAPARSG